MTIATVLAPAAAPNRLLWLLRRSPLLSYFLIAYAFTSAYDLLVEAPGWRGFALPRLQARLGPLAGTLALGALWAAWHFTEYLASPDFAATNGGGLTPRAAGVYVLFAISLSVIMTWVFNHTRGSVLLAILVHTAVNWSQLVASELFPAAGTNEEGPLVALGVTALVLLVATRGQLGYTHPKSPSVPL